jgi:hypothetical protein
VSLGRDTDSNLQCQAIISLTRHERFSWNPAWTLRDRVPYVCQVEYPVGKVLYRANAINGRESLSANGYGMALSPDKNWALGQKMTPTQEVQRPLITPDGESYLYGYVLRIYDLYTVNGVR